MKLIDSNYQRFFSIGQSNTIYTWETKVIIEQDEFDQVVSRHIVDSFEAIPVCKALADQVTPNYTSMVCTNN